MSHSFSLSFRLGERAGDGIRDVVWLIAKHIHLHDKRAGVSISWVMPPLSDHLAAVGSCPRFKSYGLTTDAESFEAFLSESRRR